MIKPQNVKGCRDFLGSEILKKEYLFKIIKNHFSLSGFLPLETPTMENLSTLTGKYGEEGDRLIFKVLNSGDFLSKTTNDDLENKNHKVLSHKFCEKGLRYDLTVPMARYISQHQNKLTFPFKRYQIQPVWRAERPQKGRYREFYQCDGDIVGDKSLLCEVELLQIFDLVFKELKIHDFKISLNNRKILMGMAEVINERPLLIPFTCALDKLDKIGAEGVLKELEQKGLKSQSLEKIAPLLSNEKNSFEMMNQFLKNSEIGKQGLNEIQEILTLTEALGIHTLEFTPTLARGLDYYTGTIFEVGLEESSIGSIASGGRYDHLTEIFGVKDLSGVGISFGAERIYDILTERDLFPKELEQNTQILIVNFGNEENVSHLKMASKLRKKGFITQLYPSPLKMKKQMKFAHEKKIPLVIIVGQNERENNIITIKDMFNGEQFQIKSEELESKIKSLLLL